MRHDTLKHFEYHKWANQKVFEHLKNLPEELFTQEIKSVFSSISEVVIHMCVADAMWLKVLSGGSFEQSKNLAIQLNQELRGKGIEGITAFFEDTAIQYQTFFESLEDLDADITVEHPSFGRMKTSYSELMNHVINHGTYHRGNISAMLRQLGHASVPTDYVFYLLNLNETTS